MSERYTRGHVNNNVVNNMVGGISLSGLPSPSAPTNGD